jgi:hypothetical protein
MQLSGKTIGLIGGLATVPRRLAARDVAQRGGILRHGMTRKTDLVVLGRKLLGRANIEDIEAKLDAIDAAERPVFGEREFLVLLAGGEPPFRGSIDAGTLSAQSGLSLRETRLLAVFGAFEGDGVSFAFSDAILARKYKGLIAGGATWLAIARSLQNAAPATSLTAYTLHHGPSGTIYGERGAIVSELSGQTFLPLEADHSFDADDLFDAAEDAEAHGERADAIALYRQCLAVDPGDSVAAFNLANCLQVEGREADARHHFVQAIKSDPTFVEAWFNLAALFKQSGDLVSARTHLQRAIAIDPGYADAIYNLAALDFEAGHYAAARAGWQRYRELDSDSEWAEAAGRGIRYVDLHDTRKASGA